MESGAKKVQPSRANHTQVGAYVPMEAHWTLQELMIRKGRERGRKLTISEVVIEALRDYGIKHGVDLPLGKAE